MAADPGRSLGRRLTEVVWFVGFVLLTAGGGYEDEAVGLLGVLLIAGSAVAWEICRWRAGRRLHDRIV